MEITAALNKTVTGTPEEIKRATEYLQKIEKSPGFASQLVSILSDNNDQSVQISASIYFKNFVAKYWPSGEDQDYVIPENERKEIKNKLVTLMFSPNRTVQKQISDTLGIVSTVEFPEQWPEILPQLLQLTQQSITNRQPVQTINLLKATYSILQRFKNADNIESVNRELSFVLGHIAKPLEEQFKFCKSVLSVSPPPDAATLATLFQILHQLLKIFYCINIVDLPHVIEDRLDFWMKEQHLAYFFFESSDPKLIGDDDDEKPGCLLKVKADICDNLSIYIQKYEEEFEPYLPVFVKGVWALLASSNSNDPKYDQLVTKGLGVLTSVSKGVYHKNFEKDDLLKSTCEKIIVPNMSFRDSDEIHFEEEFVEYIRADLEGSNSMTRRNGSGELIIGLRKYYEAPVTQLLAGYITELFNQYKLDRSRNWKQKDVALCLLTSLTVSGSTRLQGVTMVNPLIPIESIFNEHVLPELLSEDSHPVIQADALRFVITFRNQIAKARYGDIFEGAIRKLSSKQYVVNTYAATVIEKLLTVKDGRTPRFGPADVKPFVERILSEEFKLLERSESEDNDYIMKSLMRILSFASPKDIPLDLITQKLLTILTRITKKPATPIFNHYLFECIASLAKSISIANPAHIVPFENFILPTFNSILQNDINNYTPYIYQLLSMFFELNPGELTSHHVGLLNHIVAPASWSETGNIPALVRLVKAYLRKDINSIIQNQKLVPILGIFGILVKSSMQDHFAFDILRVILDVTPAQTIQGVIVDIFKVIFERLSIKKTAKVESGFVLFLSQFVLKYSFTLLNQVTDAIQKGIINRILAIWEQRVGTFQIGTERTLAIVGTVKLLCEAHFQTNFPKEWQSLFVSLAKTFTVKKKVEIGEEDENDTFELEQNRQLGVQTSFAELVHSRTKPPADPYADIARAGLDAFAIQQFKSLDRPVLNALIQPIVSDPAVSAFAPPIFA